MFNKFKGISFGYVKNPILKYQIGMKTLPAKFSAKQTFKKSAASQDVFFSKL